MFKLHSFSCDFFFLSVSFNGISFVSLLRSSWLSLSHLLHDRCATKHQFFFFLALIELHYDLQVAIRVTQTIFPLNPNNKANYLHITFLLASRHLDKNSTHYFASSNTFAKKKPFIIFHRIKKIKWKETLWRLLYFHCSHS